MKSWRARKLVLRLAYARCEHDGGGNAGPCNQCFRTELERHVARTNRDLFPEDVVRRVDEWMSAVSPELA
jgi:hypothetical protein